MKKTTLPKFNYEGFVKSKNKIEYTETHKLSQLDWNIVSKHQRLSAKFIEKFKELLNWDLISEYQILGEEIIRKFQNKVNWALIMKYQDIRVSMVIEFEEEISMAYLQRGEPSGL